MKGFMVFSLAVGAIFLSSPTSAHHGNAAYDSKNPVTLNGAVTEWDWANPHCILLFDVTDDKEQVAHWTAETSNPADMVNHGWSKQTLKPGDPVTITLEPAKNGKRIGRVLQVVLPNGQKLTGGFLPSAAPYNGTAGGPKPDDAPKK